MTQYTKHENSKDITDELNYVGNNEEYAKESALTSTRYKRNINRFFRNNLKLKRIPYPEVDNAFWKMRDIIFYLFIDKKRH